MKEIILIEIISIVSFLYSIFMMSFYIPSSNQIGIVFLWTALSSFVYALNHTKSKIYEFTILLLLLPLVFYHEKNIVILILSTAILMFIYMKTSLYRGSHNSYVNRIKKTYLIYIPLVYIRSLLDNLGIHLAKAIPFIIIYFLSSIMLVRTIRHLDSQMDIRNIRRNNIRQIIIISAVFFLTTFEKLRSSVFDIGKKMLEIIYYPLYLLGRMIGKDLENFEGEIIEDTGEIVNQIDADKLETEQIESLGEAIKREPLDLTVIKVLSGVILVIILIYIIYRLIKKQGSKRYESGEYIEEREYIKSSKEKKKLFKRERYPRELREQIRYYYRKFLNKLSKRNVEIFKTDSSLEINKKAEEVLGGEISRIREIYINSRYSKMDIDESMVKEMKDLYKKL